jgi:hypothetical protein
MLISPVFLPHNQEEVLEILSHLSTISYGAVTLCGIPFQGILNQWLRLKESLYPTSLLHFWADSVCSGLFSVALTSSIPLVSFPAGTKMFPFPALPCQYQVLALLRSLIRRSPVQCIRAARRSISSLVTSFFSF